MCSLAKFSCYLFFMVIASFYFFFFFFNDTATTEIYTLSLHDALPISSVGTLSVENAFERPAIQNGGAGVSPARSEEHTSELQSQANLVCRLLLEKKKKTNMNRSQQPQSI